jgi:D-alanyl-D-alanine carboxypeptidase
MHRIRPASLAMVVAVILLVAAPTPADTVREVQNQVAGLLAHPVLQEAQVGALAVSLYRGDEIYRANAERPLIPASNMKLVTVATAMELLGPASSCPTGVGASADETLMGLSARILKPSDNELADALLLALPEAAGRPELTPPALCAETWGERGLYLYGTQWHDGSGLSRQDMMSAEVIVGLLRAMDSSRHRDSFLQALPLAGVDGTLRTRMTDGPARGRVRAKTGTLTGVCALSGYATTLDGERLAFALVANGYSCEIVRVRRIFDQVCHALVTLEREELRAEQASGH